MLNILGFVVIIVVTIFAYKTAKDYERNAVLWALLTFGIGFGIQIVLPILIFIVVLVAMIASGSTQQQAQQAIPDITITMICLVLSVVACFIILRHLAQIPEEKSFNAPPAPPTDFNQNS
jgi:O-antigen ligase